ncbi:response regulator transcription factor [Poseidonibacter lekithochrous]|uniref:response regulator transcription factor n=1 Tax=Poseidonibacter lekithochrous TaxID=1904463 RepID=UPI0008FCC6D0|nr:response regulator transcription factor [Poseidonibacter lekithochrous]QKJ21814.1 two-component system response regulator [Poseidonibacter lekithochrous]
MDEIINPYSILFVEDEELIRKNYVRYLKRYYETVYEASDGEQAYEIYKTKKPEILIVDINLPKMNGLELLSKIRESDHTTRAIVLTAHSDMNYLLKAAELKLTKYLIKPVDRIHLKEALHLVNMEIDKFEVKSKKIITFSNDFSWNYDYKELCFNNKIIEITPQEKKILELFFENTNKVLTYDSIILKVWNEYEFEKIDALKTTIKNLRKKLPEGLISNIYGLGYKLTI